MDYKINQQVNQQINQQEMDYKINQQVNQQINQQEMDYLLSEDGLDYLLNEEETNDLSHALRNYINRLPDEEFAKLMFTEKLKGMSPQREALLKIWRKGSYD